MNLEIRGDAGAVPPNACLGLYRIVQESLANVAKHQPRSGADVMLDCGRRGAAPHRQQPAGGRERPEARRKRAKGMRERAELLGGTFHAGPKDGRWVVEVALGDPVLAPHESGCPWGPKRTQPSPDPA